MGETAERLDWATDGRDWPNRAASRFVEAGGLRWHVQVMGQGPDLLLIHGTGASTHSWREMMPLLARRFRVVAPDLPGHGFTAMPKHAQGLSLPGMAVGVAQLMTAVGVAPEIAAGHSAGAAILARMSLEGTLGLKTLISLNGALLPFGGIAGRIFSPIAKMLVNSEFVPRFTARRAADPDVLARFIGNTGSKLDATGTALYGQLARSPGHVAAALGMMANWDLNALAPDLPRLTPRVVLVAAGLDKMIKPDDSFRLREQLAHAEVVYLRDLGHLAHEERPAELAELIIRQAVQGGLLSAP
jgi:magnesium chelatase accessory protein